MPEELERFDPAAQGGRIAYEHLHRYALCREHVGGRRVLDLACGTGYGSAILADVAAAVTGVDISATAIASARIAHARSNLTFRVADCFNLPFDDGSFDVVVANEMIEHVADHDALLHEVRRILLPGGLLLVSTPNKPVYNRFKSPNLFHVSEMTLPEFEALLERHFRHVCLTGTRLALLSVGYPLADVSKEDAGNSNLDAARIYLGGGAGNTDIATGGLQLADPEYVLAACSDAPMANLPVPASLFVNPNDDLWLEHERILAWASGLHEEDEALRAELAQVRAQLEQQSTSPSQQRQLLSRLLSNMANTAVGADDTDIVGSLFDLNARLVEERLRREAAEAGLARQSETFGALAALREELAERSAMVAALRDNLDKATAKLADLTASAAQSRANAEELERLIDSERSARSELSRVNDDLKAALASLAEAHSAQAEAEIAVVRTQAELATQAAALAQSEGARAALAEEMATATATARAALAASAAAQSRLEQERDRLHGELATRQQERDLAIAALANGDAALRDAREALVSAQQDSVRLAQYRDALSDEVATLTRRLADTELAGQRGAAERDMMRQRLTEVENRFAASQGELLAMRQADEARQAAQAVAANARVARKARLDVLHRRVADEVSRAPQRVAGRIAPPPPPRPRRFTQKLLGRPGRLDTSIFSADWLERQRTGASTGGLVAYLADPALYKLDPHPLFAASAYLLEHADVAEAGLAPLRHYVEHGWREGRSPHPLFPNDWYLARNPDVLADGSINPLDHYLQHGWREGRWPNPLFNPRAYLERYPDVAAAGVEPFTHYLMHGEAEGREAMVAGWDAEWPRSIGSGSAVAVMRHLLAAPPPPTDVVATAEPQQSGGRVWPPEPVDDFWPTDTMREMVQERHGDAALAQLWYLMSLMQRWRDRQTDFAASDDCRHLLKHLQKKAAARAVTADRVPDASVIIPVYNNVLDTMLCIASLLNLEDSHDFEVIVADDGSSDATAMLVGSIGGVVRHLRQPQNLGFLGNCNSAARTAKGRHVVLLNNDTLLFPGWLDGLLTPFADHEGVGLVGSMLINWDGTLQEAGGIFWRDGSAWNFGRNQDARAPEFNYLKDVDYCSGASIAVPAAVWHAVGGFDPLFTPAYCEDSDLAFRLRAAGYRTLYSPASQVVHHEGRSHGRDVSSGIKAYQVLNGERLFDRWRSVLEREHYPNAQNVLRARDRSFDRRHVLVVDHYVPQWDKDAGSRTLYQYMKLLVEQGFAVTFWPDNLWRDPAYTPRLQQLGVEVIHGSRFVGAFTSFMQDRADLYDLVLLSRPHVAVNYLDAIRQYSTARIVYYGHDLHHRRMAAGAAVGQQIDPNEIESMRQMELAVCRASNVILYPDPEEVAAVKAEVGGNREFIANPVFLFSESEIAEARNRLTKPLSLARGEILFVGGFRHEPNREGILWFVQSVLPLIRQRRPDVVLRIAGSHPPSEVVALTNDKVEVLGFVSDAELAALYAAADLAIAPLRFGAGVKGKVIEAMAKGVPVATTSVGAQGICDPSRTLFVGDSPIDLADAVLQALDDRNEAHRRRCHALEFIAEHYAESNITALFDRLSSTRN